MSKTIRVEDETYDRLIKTGSYGETMDDIINRLFSKAQKKGGSV